MDKLQDTYFDEVANTMKNEGQSDISDFLLQLKRRKEEAKRKREEELRELEDADEKKVTNKVTNQKPINGKQQPLDKHGKPIPYWKPILVLPQEKYMKDFVDKGESIKTV